MISSSNTLEDIIDNCKFDVDEDNFVLASIDVDGDDLSFNIDEISNATFTLVNNLITILPNQDFNGGIEIGVSVSDGQLADTTLFNLDVLPVNDPPSLSNILGQSINEDETP